MRVERISVNQFTIFLTYDDLIERGFTKEDLKYHANIQELFSEMMFEASDELGIELSGFLSIHVLMMQAQGMHIRVTQNVNLFDDHDYIVQMEFTLDESDELIFYVDDFDAFIQVAPHLFAFNLRGGQIYHFENRYYMLIEHHEVGQLDEDDIIAVMAEFAYPSMMSSHRLKEYGKAIFAENAVTQLVHYFYQA